MRMKKLTTLALSAAMMLTMATTAFAAEITPAETDDTVPPTAETVKVTKPSKVQDVKVLKNGYKSLKVTWKKVDGAAKYEVYRSTTGKSGSFVLKKTTTGTSYTNTGITCGKTYYYKVRAVNSKGKGSFSATKSSKVIPATVKISKIKCIKEFKLRVYWNKVSGASGYQVYRTKKGANNWKLYKTVSSKYNYATNYLEGDTKYSKWEYKVRAYRTVNGKKVYGYFSKPTEWKPDWTIDEIYEELWKYGESLKFPLYEYANPDGSDNEDGEWLVPKKDGSTYNFKHMIGSYTLDKGENYFGVYTNPKNGETEAPKGAIFKKYTPDNMSWDVAFPERISYYDTKASLLKRLKPIIKAELKDNNRANPVYWANAYIDGAFGPNGEDEYWNGVQAFSIYIEKDRNGYKIYSLW